MISRNSILSFLSVIILLIILTSSASGPILPSAGHVTSEVRKFKVVPVQKFNLSIGKNWSLISTPLRPVYPDVNNFLSPLENWSIIETYDISMPSYCSNWSMKLNGIPSACSFDKVDVYHGYWLKINESGAPDKLEIEGIVLPEISIPLVSGWNLIGFPMNTTEEVPIDTALSSINGNWTLLYKYNPETGNFSRAVAGIPWTPDSPWMANITIGYGYWINVKNNTTLRIYNNVTY